MKKVVSGLFLVIVFIAAAVFGVIHFFPEKVVEVCANSERGKAGLRFKSIAVGELTYAYLEGGTGEPLVLVHGFGANKDNWTRVAEYLAPHFKVIALDLAGYGESTINFDLDYTITAQADRLHEFVDALDLKSFHLGGSSMGGAISGTYGSKHQDRVLSLWLIAPGNVLSSEESELGLLLKEGKNPLITQNAEEYKSLIAFVFEKTPHIPSPILGVFMREAFANKALNDKVFAEIVKEKLSLEDLLAGLAIPTLVLWGDHDRVLHVSGAGILCKAMVNASCVIMKNTGHLPMIERPEEAARSFLRFHHF
ncbi:lipase [Desulfoluna limicola]|uniref:Lipase n=1 Tax=Desulfoluna limicola TaxID=2810562 RepID=A0ABN6F3S3_9BACT|nr:alpha/beta fold hydrolase [Desulfoluna limicola]BCS95694.1 lipase [Desulfoluna limicola]